MMEAVRSLVFILISIVSNSIASQVITPKVFASAAIDNNNLVYITGGLKNGSLWALNALQLLPTSDLVVWDANLQDFSPRTFPSMNFAHGGHSSATNGNFLYVFGGSNY